MQMKFRLNIQFSLSSFLLLFLLPVGLEGTAPSLKAGKGTEY